MRGNVPAYEVKAPRTLGEALELMSQGGWKPLAGGTDLMVLLEMGVLEHKRLLSLHAISELKGIREEKDRFILGALTTFGEIQRHAAIREQLPLLCEAAASVGAIAIQNRGTIAGNIANASPAADGSPALLALGARVELVSRAGARWVDYSDFHTAYKKTALKPDELIRSIEIPKLAAGSRHFFRKVGTRKAQAISKVCLAALIRLENKKVSEIRLAYGSVAATPLRARRTEELLRGKPLDMALIREAKRMLMQEIAPIDDIRSSAEYRGRVSLNLLEDFLIHVELGR